MPKIKNEKIQEKNNGKVKYSDDILISIVGLSVAGVDGVKVRYKKDDNSKLDGIKIVRDNEDINVYVTVDVYYGYIIPEVSYHIQQSIKHNVETMSNFKLNKINVSVDNVVYKEEK